MKEDKGIELLFDLSNKLSSIDGKLGQLCSTIQNHETRLQTLEKTGSKDDSRWLVQWLLKGLLISIGIIATLTGSAGII